MRNTFTKFLYIFIFLTFNFILFGNECVGNVCKVKNNNFTRKTYLNIEYGLSTNFEFKGVDEIKNTEDYFEFYQLIYENDTLKTVEYYQQNRLTNGGVFGVAKVFIVYDSLGKEFIFKDKNDKRIRSTDGVYKMKLIEQSFIGEKGKIFKRVCKILNFDENDKIFKDKYGVEEYRYFYNKDGLFIEQQHLESETIVVNIDGCAKIKWKYDDHGRLMEESYYDKKGNLSEIYLGYAKKRFVYNSKGQLEKISYTDEDDMLVNNVYGYALEIYKYDENGEVDIVKYLNKHGMEILPKF